MVMNPRVFSGKYPEQLNNYELSRKILHHGVSYMSNHYLIARSCITLYYITQRDFS
jgi:hypothetical protein